MSPKELFRNNRALADQWNAVAKATWFSEVLMHARAQLFESEKISPEQIEGAKKLEAILLDLAEGDGEKSGALSPGLVHQIDNPGIRPIPPKPKAQPIPTHT